MKVYSGRNPLSGYFTDEGIIEATRASDRENITGPSPREKLGMIEYYVHSRYDLPVL